MTIHRVSSADIAEINRVLALIQKKASEGVHQEAVAGGGTPEGVGAGTSGGVKGDKGDTGAPGADGNAAAMLVGSDQFVEILLDQNGSVLTDELGMALLGVKVATTIITGTGVSSIEVLNAT